MNPVTFDRDTSLGYVVNHLARVFEQALYRRIVPHGARPGQFPVLLCLWAEEGLTQAELTRRLAIEQPTMANTLKRMERDGLIVRRPDARDGRRALVYLTDRGRDLQAVLTGQAAEVNGIAGADVSEEEKALFLDLARRMIARLEADQPDT